MDAAFHRPIYRFGRWDRASGHLDRIGFRIELMGKRLSEAEFEQAVEECLPQLVAVARRLSGDEEIAAEAVQQALLRASRAWRKFKQQSHISTWLTQIVIHEVRRTFAKHKRPPYRSQEPISIEASENEAAWAAPPHQQPPHQAMQTELKQLVQRLVGDLPTRQREVFALIVWEGMEVDVVAKLLGIKNQNVYSHLHEAKKKLRTQLEMLGHYGEARK